MTDFHTHILPGMDDGSKTVEMSLEMLRREAKQGIHKVVLTPHFYAHQNSPERFLQRRAQAWDLLAPELTPDLPELYLGAEVQYFEGICRVEDLNRLCFAGGRLLLLEMPFQPWSSRAVEDVLELAARPELQIIMAHVERYFHFTTPEVLQLFRDSGVAIQSNADFFLNRKTRHRAISMYRRGEIQLLSSDCHNLTNRAPNLGPGMDLIRKYQI